MNTITRIHHALLSITAVALLSVGASVRGGEVNASLSSREAYVGAPVTLRLEIANASSHNEPQPPDVAGLDIQSAGSPSRSTQTTIINGRRTDRTSAVYAWRIIPRREGAFVIPGISTRVDGKLETTTPLRFVATKSETGDLLLAEVTGQQQKIYVGQPLKLTLNLWIKPYRDAEHKLTVSEADTWQMISETTNWGPFTDRLTELANNNQRPAGEELLRKDATGAEHSYYRYQLEATIYPKRPGQIDADDLQIVVDYPTRLAETRDGFDSMFDSDFFNSGFPFGNRDISPFRRRTLSVAASRPLVAQATVAPIEVSPVPTAGRPADYRGAVGQYQIVTQAVPIRVQAGDPITLHIGISGDGPMDLVQAPPLAELPQLTADFKVTNEPLAGVVDGEAKLFTTTIRPRHAGIAQIPAIPLSFFDPSSEQFVTVHSDPISIEVAEADRLALDSIVGAAATQGTQATTADQPQLDFSNEMGPEVIVSAVAPSVWPSPWLLWVPPLFVASLWSFRRRRHLAGLLQGTARERLRSAQQAVDSSRSASDVASAVRGYVADYLKCPSATLTRSEIAARLKSNDCRRGAQQQLDEVLARCELATYACSENWRLAALKSSAVTSLAELPQVPHARTGAESARPKHRRRKLASACLLFAALAVTVTTVALVMRHRADSSDMASQLGPESTTKTIKADAPISLSPSQCATILAEANDAYQRGMQASQNDAALAKESFSTAASKYQLLLYSGIHNSPLYCNLGNAYLQSGLLGRAIANYERALLLDASNTKAQASLDAARRAIPTTVSGASAESAGSHTLKAVAARLNRFLSPAVGHRLLVATWILVWATAVGALCLPHRRWRYALIPAMCLLFVCAAVTSLAHRDHPRNPQGIVALGTAILRQAPGDNFAAVTNRPLPEGQSLTVLQDRDSWLRVQTPDGQSGWIDSLAIERVAPQQNNAT